MKLVTPVDTEIQSDFRRLSLSTQTISVNNTSGLYALTLEVISDPPPMNNLYPFFCFLSSTNYVTTKIFERKELL
jgi:hypothetical protein